MTCLVAGFRHGGRAAWRVAATVLVLSVLAGTAPAAASITLTNFAARAQGQTIVVTWETGTEMDTVGFWVRRGATADLNQHARVSAFVPATGTTIVGDRYAWTDAQVSPGVAYFYSLEDRAADQHTTFHGPICARLDGVPCDAEATSTATPPPDRTARATASRTPPNQPSPVATSTTGHSAGPPPTAAATRRSTGSAPTRTVKPATSQPSPTPAPAATTSYLRPVSTAGGGRGEPMPATGVAGGAPLGSVVSSPPARPSGGSPSTREAAASPMGQAPPTTAGVAAGGRLGTDVGRPGDASAAPAADDPGAPATREAAAPDGRIPAPHERQGNPPAAAPAGSRPLAITLMGLVFVVLAWRVTRLLRRG